MSSLSKQTPAKPRLQRRNARKIDDFEAVDSSPSPITAGLSPLFSRDASHSFRVDSIEEMNQLLQELGLPEGPDAFGIPPEAWQARPHIFTSHTGPTEIQDEHAVQRTSGKGDKILETPSALESKRGGRETPTTPLSSSSGSKFPSFTSSSSSDPMSIHSFVQDQVLFSHVEPPHPQGVGLFASIQEEGKPLHTNARHSTALPVVEPGLKFQRSKFEEPGHSDVLEAKRPISLPPPPGSSLQVLQHLSSTHELLLSLAPDEGSSLDTLYEQKDDTSTSDQDSEGGSVVEDDEHAVPGGFAVQQHELPATVDERMIPLRTGPGRIQAWTKLDLLGSGSFGTVYEAVSEDGLYFAVKEVSLSEHDSKTQQCVFQLEQEIDVLSKYQHENIVRYLGTQREHDRLYIFLELVTKGSLSSLYQKHPLYDFQIRSYTRQILSGLNYLHNRNIVHRDIKCANILVDANRTVKLADFGLARQISQLIELKSCKGSAYWMAPEVVDPRKTYSFPADIWSLGCTVLEMATRSPPFGNMEWHRALWKLGHGEAPPIPENLSQDAKDFIRKCLEVDPRKRPAAAELLEHPFVCNMGSGTELSPRSLISSER